MDTHKKVTDLKTGELVAQNLMFKRLFKRSGMKRVEWHAKATEKAGGRSLGSETKISDIFKGARTLPMRDIVPYIQALGLKTSETNHYICEFFRCHCDQNLHQYISRHALNKSTVSLKFRIALLEADILELQDCISRYKLEDIPLLEKQMESQVNALRKQKERANQLAQGYRNELMTTLNTLRDLYFASKGGTQIPHPVLQKVERALENGFDLEGEPYEEIIEDHYEDEKAYFEFLDDTKIKSMVMHSLSIPVQWFIVLNLLIVRDCDENFKRMISAIIPQGAIKTLSNLSTEHAYRIKGAAFPEFRSHHEVLMHFFCEYRVDYPEIFKEELDRRITIRFGSPTEASAAINVRPFTLNRFVEDALGKNQKQQVVDFKSFLDNKMAKILNIPTELYVWPRPRISQSNCREFDVYIDFLREGLAHRLDIQDIYLEQNPKVSDNELSDKELIKTALDNVEAIITDRCSTYEIENPIDKFIKSPLYPNNFKPYICIENEPDTWFRFV